MTDHITTAEQMFAYLRDVEATPAELPKRESWTGRLMEGGPIVTLYSSIYLVGDSEIINRRYNQTLVGGLNEIGMFAVMILKACDASGKRMFKFADYDVLKNRIGVDVPVLVFNALFLEQFKRMGLVNSADDADPHEARVGN